MFCLLVLMAYGTLYAADAKSGSISIFVKPAIVVTSAGPSAVQVKLRLSASSSAQVWISDTCVPDGTATQVLSQSGEYTIPLAVIKGTGSMVCVVSVLDGLYGQVRVPSRPGGVLVETSQAVQTVSSI